MEDDIVDFEDFDYGDLGDVNPDDLDIENLERELGLLKEESESVEPKAENDKKPPTLKPDESTAPSKQEEKPKIADKPSIKPSYTSAPPKRAPFVPHSAASFPQYPFVQQGMMGMNMMMPPMSMPFPGMPMMMGYPPRPMGNKIHINPKFAAMQAQKQQQPRPPATPDVTQDEIDRQRQHLLEVQRRRQANVAPQQAVDDIPPATQKRKLATDQEEERDHKRPFTIKGLSKGITIKGAAAAAESSMRSKPAGGILDRISSPSKKPIADRISSPSLATSHPNGPSRKRELPSTAQERSPKRQQVAVPIATKNKSSMLVIRNLSEATTRADLMDLGKPAGMVTLDFKKADKEAIMSFKTADAAVILRRKYNRTSFKGSHIVISFA